jgi:protein TIF31
MTEGEVKTDVVEEGEGGNELRQSPIDITVVTPNGKKVLLASVNPAEPSSYIKQMLQEFQETASFTNYNFDINGTAISDYIEISNYAPPEDDMSMMTITLVPTQYDIKKSRVQLKRVRDIIAYPPIARGAPVTENQIEEGNGEDSVEADLALSKDTKKSEDSDQSKLPKPEEIFNTSTLESFFAQTMLRAGTVDPIASGSVLKLPSECVKSISASGYNPPPPARRSQGDLLYLEAVTGDHIYLYVFMCIFVYIYI